MSAIHINGDEYVEAMDQIMAIIPRLLMLRLADVNEVLEMADTVGPYVDPTAWIHKRGSKNVEEQLAIVRPLLAAQRALLKIPAIIALSRRENR